MKSGDVIGVLANEFGSRDLNELNQILKSPVSQKIKFRMMVKKPKSKASTSAQKFILKGYTVAIKSIATDSLKFFDVNKVSLIKFEMLESFGKAKPRVERPVVGKATKKNELTKETELAQASATQPKKTKAKADPSKSIYFDRRLRK